MEVVVVLFKTQTSWALFGVFSSIERAMAHVDEARKKERVQTRFIRAEVGQIYSEKEPPAETLG